MGDGGPFIKTDDDGIIVQINQYELKGKLGQGSFAEVYLAKASDDERQCAAKIFNKSLLRRKRTMERTADGVKIHSELEKVSLWVPLDFQFPLWHSSSPAT